MNAQHDRAAANAAIFDEGLFPLRRVDLQRKRLAAMRADNLRFVNQFHFVLSRSRACQMIRVDQRPGEFSSNTILDRKERSSRPLN